MVVPSLGAEGLSEVDGGGAAGWEQGRSQGQEQERDRGQRHDQRVEGADSEA
jgi:hypothetical protein